MLGLQKRNAFSDPGGSKNAIQMRRIGAGL
jgi:hypothetical protein